MKYKGDLGGIRTVEQLDEALRLLGILEIKIDRINQEMHLRQDEITAAAAAAKAPIAEQHAALKALVQTFVEARRDEVIPKPAKTRTLNFGTVGFRKNPDTLELPGKRSDEMADVVARIEGFAGMGQEPFTDIAIRTDRYVQVGDLKPLRASELKALGLERTNNGETFFATPDIKKLEDVSDG